MRKLKVFVPCRTKPLLELNEGVVSKETVVLRRWGSSIQKFGFINGVDNVNWPPYRDSVLELFGAMEQSSHVDQCST